MVHVTSTTVHQHYDVEKPGYHGQMSDSCCCQGFYLLFIGYDRRHYPEKHRFTLSDSVYKPRGRAHVPSPPLEEQRWRPHGRYMDPHYSK